MNLAGYCAIQGGCVVLADCDPQSSCYDWLSRRPGSLVKIHGVRVKKDKLHIPEDTDTLILDAAASMDKKRIEAMLRIAHKVVIPVLPSPIDICAAERFLIELSKARKKVRSKKIKVATIANRVQTKTLAGQELETYLTHLTLPNGKKIKFLTALRASQSYIRAATQGMTIFELPPYKTAIDQTQWRPLCKWVMRI